jgi:hypothetical protein
MRLRKPPEPPVPTIPRRTEPGPMHMRRSECDLADTNARTSRTEGGPLLVEVGRLPVVGVIRVTRRAPDGALALQLLEALL